MKSNLTIKDSSIAFVSGFLFCYFFSALLLVVLSLFLHINTSDIDVENFSNSVFGSFFLGVSLQIGILLVFLNFNKSKENKITDNFSWKKLGIYSLVAIASFLLLSPFISCIEKLLLKLNLSPSGGIKYELNIKNYFISIISLVLFPAVCEELLFRGLIFKGLKQNGKIFSITLSSLAFSIFHMSIFQTIYPILFGLLLGIIMYKENNIIYTITMHMINNFLSLTFMFLKIDFFINHWLFFVVALLLLATFIYALVYIIKTTKETNKQSITKTEIISLTISFTIMTFLWIIFNIYGT